VAHVIPASLGNNAKSANAIVLRPGIECDRCNERFGRRVENHFLSQSSGFLARLRAVPNRRGRYPTVAVSGEVLLPNGERRKVKGLRVTPARDSGTESEGVEQEVSFTVYQSEHRFLTSAFLSKLAVEFVAFRLGRDVALHRMFDAHRRNALSPNKSSWHPFYRAMLSPRLARDVHINLNEHGVVLVVYGCAFFLPWLAAPRDRLPELVFHAALGIEAQAGSYPATLSHPAGLRRTGDCRGCGRIDIRIAVGSPGPLPS